jgi:hypothetical protein
LWQRIHFTVEKSSPIIGATSVIFKKKLPKKSSHPMGENSANLVTLVSLVYPASLHKVEPRFGDTFEAGLPDGFFSIQKSQFG